jgi:hypothetical protein
MAQNYLTVQNNTAQTNQYYDQSLNKNFAVEGSYTDYSSDTTDSSMSAANGAALEAARLELAYFV